MKKKSLIRPDSPDSGKSSDSDTSAGGAGKPSAATPPKPRLRLSRSQLRQLTSFEISGVAAGGRPVVPNPTGGVGCTDPFTE